MCGICGIVNLDGSRRLAGDERARAVAMLRAMSHRGPDGEARLMRGNAVIAANHLAIRSSHPPLLEYDAGILVACNGEIDNHRDLRQALSARGRGNLSASDVAVIAPLYVEYGPAFLDRLQGAFALALWDPRCQRLVLARDRAGERHLYYSVAVGRVAFASELAALSSAFAGVVGLDRAEVAHYLRSGYCRARASALQGVRKVAPGEAVLIDADGASSRRYWSLPTGGTAERPSREAFDRVLRGAVMRQSDVNADYGVLLSGGVDSALVTALLRKLHPARRLPAYSIRFAEASFDEGKIARRVARDLGCEWVPVTVTADDFPRRLQALIAATGEMVADPAWIPVAKVAERASQDVRMLFGGEGADELFAGYPTYLGARWAPCYSRLPGWIRGPLRHAVEAWPVNDRKMSLSFMLKRFVQEQPDGLARHLAWTATITPDRLRRLGFEPPRDWRRPASREALDAVQQHDFTHLLPEAYLAKADRGGMLHGVEIRTPFLDRDVIEFASRLPVRARVRGFTTKVFLKQYALRYLPAAVVNRRKRGLSVPLSIWLRGSLHEWARSRLGSGDLARAGIDAHEALLLLTEHARREKDHTRAIWTLIVLSEWLAWRDQVNTTSLAARPPDRDPARPARPDSLGSGAAPAAAWADGSPAG